MSVFAGTPLFQFLPLLSCPSPKMGRGDQSVSLAFARASTRATMKQTLVISYNIASSYIGRNNPINWEILCKSRIVEATQCLRRRITGCRAAGQFVAPNPCR
jgi:hypothetical protein